MDSITYNDHHVNCCHYGRSLLMCILILIVLPRAHLCCCNVTQFFSSVYFELLNQYLL